ncbi:F-box protein [Aspergillus clavatus NRRL 1]|uniref:F-box domain protein n=1 Tax=Aspergillus clavatus (strain ATCC 1007 / CBS 513.65 / DSM 816 / NCTC 3887 / NRRL 1 / QM 1276 / 107) TaxID=344612 RepID=A1CS19_ASPCL|nr:F-box domain protein [Aspergillus clavatus NRRL 1]EAW08440.1 F-box domain protein [Aspergillus clavatus NRRL 1]
MSDKISRLPLEVLLSILAHLPFESLLAFGGTSRMNFKSHALCLRRLRIGVFEKRVHSVISLLQAGWATPDQLSLSQESDGPGGDYTISVIQPGIYMQQEHSEKAHIKSREWRRRAITPREALDQTIRTQNKVLSRLVNRYGSSLVKLEFMAYDIDLHGAKALGTRCRHALRHLALRFEHPHIRDGPMRPTAWYHPAPGSTAWNVLCGVGNYKAIGLTGLETLILERSGITPWQLMMLVKRNPKLRVLKLRTCRGAEPEFLDWLGGIQKDEDDAVTDESQPAPGAKLEVLWLENCNRILTPVGDQGTDTATSKLLLRTSYSRCCNKLTIYTLQSLSFRECACISSEYVEKSSKTIWDIPEVILPYAFVTQNTPIEVDPLLS